jgi:hypothetical protein
MTNGREPAWSMGNLRDHYDRHPAGEDSVCWRDLLDQQSVVSEAQYDDESVAAWRSHWLEYLATKENVGRERRYFVDRRVVVVVTDYEERTIITCFHKHYPNRRNHVVEDHLRPIGEHRAKYLTWLKRQEQFGVIRDVEIRHDAYSA